MRLINGDRGDGLVVIENINEVVAKDGSLSGFAELSVALGRLKLISFLIKGVAEY